MGDNITTQELIDRMKSADRRYRRSTTALLITIGFAVVFSVFLQYRALEQFKVEAIQRAADSEKIQEANKAEAEKTNRYLQCIARFFADPNRQDRIIKSIDDCNIDSTTGSAVPGVSKEPVASKEKTDNSGSSDFLVSGPAATGPSSSNTGSNSGSGTGSNPGSGSSSGGGGGDDGDGENTPPRRNVIQRNITDPLVKDTFNLVNDTRAIIGL